MALFAAFIAIMLGLLGMVFGRDMLRAEYRDCRKIAAIEVCVKHLGLEKPN